MAVRPGTRTRSTERLLLPAARSLVFRPSAAPIVAAGAKRDGDGGSRSLHGAGRRVPTPRALALGLPEAEKESGPAWATEVLGEVEEEEEEGGEPPAAARAAAARGQPAGAGECAGAGTQPPRLPGPGASPLGARPSSPGRAPARCPAPSRTCRPALPAGTCPPPTRNPGFCRCPADAWPGLAQSIFSQGCRRRPAAPPINSCWVSA
ncbi:palmitoyltransferase ZDHHC21 isoform X3 [Rhinolophus sinicus]|uniref:palmitoyltransferase ZDHHC21 isoform X3 n=1 Tax=Rhinolophus sinicus TaxID=89399 RepID=UPI003D7A84D8